MAILSGGNPYVLNMLKIAVEFALLDLRWFLVTLAVEFTLLSLLLLCLVRWFLVTLAVEFTLLDLRLGQSRS
ncbi:hypothetical protein HanRHA438_Chr01g0025621 [Helianthus annuus]|nr:hypothetical protein HanRHA438_Chr01g0025621 [Helianthus annuus]